MLLVIMSLQQSFYTKNVMNNYLIIFILIFLFNMQ